MHIPYSPLRARVCSWEFVPPLSNFFTVH
jgi:hypothetical protein